MSDYLFTLFVLLCYMLPPCLKRIFYFETGKEKERILAQFVL